nr:hypothetical protein BaRGS_021860 [Batillaria attramentaria]
MDMKLHVAIRADGTVVWFPGDTLLLSCNVDISLYPFDTQTCDIMIGSWTMSEFQMNGTEADVQLHHFRDNAEWNVVGLAWERVSNAQIPNFPYWYFRYTVTLKRRWMFYALNVLLPVLLVSSLNSVVFALPVESGDKMSVSLTTFLTLAVFLALVRDSLPSNSDGVCYLVVYLALQTLLGVLAVAVSASVVYFHYRSDTYPLCGPSQDVEPVPEVNAHLVHHDVSKI